MQRLLAILAILLLCTPAHALIPAGPDPSLNTSTVEALTAQCPVILTADVVARAPVARGNGICFNPVDILRGPLAFPLVPGTTIAVSTWTEPPHFWPAPGDRILIFVGGSDEYAPAADWKILDFVPLNKAGPACSGFANAIRDFSLRQATDPQAVLATVQAEIGRDPPTEKVKRLSVFPFDLDTVPDDDRLLPAARLWVKSPDPLARYLGVRALAQASDPRDVPALKAALSDPFTLDYPFLLSPWTGHEYAIRQAAAQALDDEHVPCPPTAFTSPSPGIYTPVPARAIGAWVTLPFAAFWIAQFIWRRLRRKSRAPARQWITSTLIFACLYCAAVSAALWHRSLSRIDNFVVAQCGLAADACSLHGAIDLELAFRWPYSTPPVSLTLIPAFSRTLSLEKGVETLFSQADSRSILESYIYGYDFSLGAEPEIHHDAISPEIGRRTRIAAPGISLAISYPVLMLLLLAFPVLRASWILFKSARRRLRDRRLASQARCAHCRYDLRAHPPGFRCPECGTPVPNAPAKTAPS